MAARARSARAEILRLQASVTSVADCPLPVIAAIHGYCIGGGVDLVAACDIRLASADAVFSVREAKVAIVADLGQPPAPPAIIGQGPRGRAGLHRQGHHRGPGRGHRTGQPGLAPTPRRCWPTPGRMAAEIAANSPLAVQGTKAVLAAGDGPIGGRGPRVRGHLERRLPGLRRPGRGHDRLHGEAAGRSSPAADAQAGRSASSRRRRQGSAPAAPPARPLALVRARPPCAPRRGPRARPR